MDELNKISSLNRMSPRLIIQQLISFGLIVCTALMIWKSLMIMSGSESPIVVVLRSVPNGLQQHTEIFMKQGF